jgi:PAS domain S-box-containing protein
LDISEEPIDTKNGKRYLHTIKAIIKDKDRKPLHLLGISEDITEKKIMQDRIVKSEEMYKLLVESADQAIFTVNKNSVILFINTPGAMMLGKKPDEIIGKKLFQLFPKSFADKHWKDIRKSFRTEEMLTFIGTSKVNGKERWFETKIKRISDKGEMPVSLLMTRDITEKKESEKSTQKRLDELERFHQVTIDRELKMVELKKRIKELEKKK